MAESTLTKITAAPTPLAGSHRSYPASVQSAWQTICTAPDAVEDDTDVVAGGKVVKPELITRAAQKRLEVGPYATHLLVALKYNDDATSSADPVIRVFGKDPNGIWHNLYDNGGTPAFEVTLATAETTDPISDGYRITTPKQFDLQGSTQVIVAIQTAFAVSGGTANDSEILVKVINSR